MGWFDKLIGGDTVRGALEGAGTLAGDIRDSVTGEGNKLKMRELETQIETARIELSKAEAQHGSVFVAGARPAILWVGALALAYQFLVRPIALAFGAEVGSIDTDALWTIIAAVLGLGGMRSWEKNKGVNDRHG